MGPQEIESGKPLRERILRGKNSPMDIRHRATTELSLMARKSGLYLGGEATEEGSKSGARKKGPAEESLRFGERLVPVKGGKVSRKCEKMIHSHNSHPSQQERKACISLWRHGTKIIEVGQGHL